MALAQALVCRDLDADDAEALAGWSQLLSEACKARHPDEALSTSTSTTPKSPATDRAAREAVAIHRCELGVRVRVRVAPQPQSRP